MYEKKYIAMFCEKLNPSLFEKRFDSLEEAEDWLCHESERARWGDMGTWFVDGKVPEHYILPKYKDVIAD